MVLHNILVWLHLRRPSKWEPPTAIDWLVVSPLQAIMVIVYRLILFLRGAPFRPPPGRPAIRVVCISDTHDQVVRVPDGDLLIHAGDLTSGGSRDDIQRQLDWLASLPHSHKIVIAGNHDYFFDPVARLPEDKSLELDFHDITYLQRSSVSLEFKNGRTLSVYGAADIPSYGASRAAFHYLPDRTPWAQSIPSHTDILVTHTPPYAHGDLGLGCRKLLEEVWRIRPRLHVFGHVHWGYGREAVYFDECQNSFEKLMLRPGAGLVGDLLPHAGWVDAVKVVLYGVHAIMWKWLMLGPGGNSGGLMVNAAQMYGNTGKTKNRAQVISI